MKIALEFEREDDGRWIAEAPQWPGVMAYGASKEEAGTRAKALALRVIADKIENGEFQSPLDLISFEAPQNEQLAVS